MSANNVKIVDEDGLLINTVRGDTTTTKFLSMHDANAHFDWWGRHLQFFTGSTTTLTQDISIGAIELPINVTASVFLGGTPTGTNIFIKDGVNEETDHVSVIDITNTTILIDRPLQHNYSTLSTLEITNEDLSLLTGTMVSPIIYKAQPASGVIVDINRIIVDIVHTTAGDNSRFGNIIGGLTNGLVLKLNKTKNKKILSQWKTNGEIKNDMFDLDYTDKAGAGLFGTSGRWSFNGREKNNFAIRLIGDRNDKFEVLVQNDLSSLTSMKIKTWGNLAPQGIVAPS